MLNSIEIIPKRLSSFNLLERCKVKNFLSRQFGLNFEFSPLVFSRSNFIIFFDIPGQRRFPKDRSLIHHFRGFSAFPKGPHQLGSRNPNKPRLEDCSRSHQIIAYQSASLFSRLTVLPFLAQTGSSTPFLGEGDGARPGPWIDVSFSVKNKTSRKNSKERLLRYTFQEPWSKGNQESFRRVPRERAETPKSWNRASAYKVHPYWSENLKYVK